MVVLEAVAIGALGLLVAGVTGVALGTSWVAMQFPLLVGWALDLHFPRWFALVGAGLTLALCILGALFPGVRASRLLVPAALRTE
jgi:ABC-type antimicrobial peptide transport system permease subunit